MLKKQVIKIAKIIAILAIMAGGGFVSIKGIYSALEWEKSSVPVSFLGFTLNGVSGTFSSDSSDPQEDPRYYGLVVGMNTNKRVIYYNSSSWGLVDGPVGVTSLDFNDVWAQDYQNFWVVGTTGHSGGTPNTGAIYRFNTEFLGTWNLTLENSAYNFYDVVGAVNTDSGKMALFVVGKDDSNPANGVIIYKTDSSNFDFSNPNTYTINNTQVNSVSAVFDNVNNKYLAWAVAKNGKVYDYDSSRPGAENGKWASSNIPGVELRGVTAVRDKDGVINVWAVGALGSEGRVYRKQGAGNFEQEYFTTEPLNSVSGVYDANKGLFKVWAVGGPDTNQIKATIVHYDGAGWQPQDQGAPAITINDVFAINSDHVWATGLQGTILTLSPGNLGGLAWMGADNCADSCVSNCELEPRLCSDGVTKRDKPFGKVSLSCVDSGLCLQKEFNYGVNIDGGVVGEIKPIEGYAWVGGSDENQIDGVVEDGSVSGWNGDVSQIQDSGDNKIRFNSGISQKSVSDLVHKQLNFKIKIPVGTNAWKFSVKVNTQNGEKEISYSSDYQQGSVINGEVYTSLQANNWHSISRDLEADLHKEEPNNSITGVVEVKAEVSGTPPEPFLMDDIKLGPVPATSWLSFNRSETGNPPGNPPGAIAKYEPATGKFSGWARFLRLKEEYGGEAGWVKLRGEPININSSYSFADCYRVELDDITGEPVPAGCENNVPSTCNFKICNKVIDSGSSFFASCGDCGLPVGGTCDNEAGTCTACSYCDKYGISADEKSGRVSGYAWSGEPSGGFGWIDFSQAYYRGKLWLKTEWSDIYSASRIGSGRTITPPSGSYNATYMLQCGQTDPDPNNECAITNFTSQQSLELGPFNDWVREAEPTMEEVKFPEVPATPVSQVYTSTIGKIDYQGLITDVGAGKNKYGQEIVIPTDSNLNGIIEFVDLTPFQAGTGNGILGGKVYYIAGDLTINSSNAIKNGSAAGESGAGLIVVDGDVIVGASGNLEYYKYLGGGESSSIDNLKKLASLGFFIKGDLLIDSKVINLVGAYFVGGKYEINPSGRYEYAGGGKIEVKGNLLNPINDKQFVNYGPMVAREFKFSRQWRGTVSSPEPAEKIIYDGRVVANPPPGFDDLSKNLPIVREVMP